MESDDANSKENLEKKKRNTNECTDDNKEQKVKYLRIVDFAEKAQLSINLPDWTAVTLYMICSFKGWVEAFSVVDEDPLSDYEVDRINTIITRNPVNPGTWIKVLTNVLCSAYSTGIDDDDDDDGDEECTDNIVDYWNISKLTKEHDKRSVNLLMDFSENIDMDTGWSTGGYPDILVKVLAFYMALYCDHPLVWIDIFSKKYAIDIPFDIVDRLSDWKKGHTDIDKNILVLFTYSIITGITYSSKQ